MKEPFITCPICSSTASFYLKNEAGFEIRRCSGCGHGWVRTSVTDSDLTRFYASKEAHGRQYDFPEKVVRKTARKLLKYMAAGGVKKGFMVDLGCGQGFHLQEARGLGWEIAGVDRSEKSRSLCGMKEIPVFESLESLEKEKGTCFADAVTLWETIEHLPDPEKTLNQVRTLLKPGGAVCLSTPNFAGGQARAEEAGWHEFLPPMHLHYFTPRSLALLLAKSGFKTIHILTFVAWNSKIEKAGYLLEKFGIPARVAFLFKVVCYKIGKPYFDRTFQRDKKGCGLLAFAYAEPGRPLSFPEFFG